MTGYNKQNACYEGPELMFSDGRTMDYDTACRAMFDVKFFGSYQSSCSSLIKGRWGEVAEQLGDEQMSQIERLVDDLEEKLNNECPAADMNAKNG